MRAAILFSLVAAAFGFGLALGREPVTESKIEAETLLAEPFAGDGSKEVNAQLYVFPPGEATPWHIHPDAHEVAYVLEGSFTFQRADGQPIALEEGEAEYLAPNVVHRGMNEGDKPVKLFVVRIKPRGKPLAEDVPDPQ